MNIFKIFKDNQKPSKKDKDFERDTLLMMRKVEYDRANDTLKRFLMDFGQTHKFITYKATGRFCEDAKRNIEFIEEMEKNTGDFKKKISEYKNAKRNYNNLLEKK